MSSLDKDIIAYDVVRRVVPFKRGQIWYIDLGEVDAETSRECGKCRPCIIIQTDHYNNMSDSTLAVVPLSKSPMYACYNDPLIAVRLSNVTGNPITSILGLNRIKFVEKTAVQNYIGDAPEEVMEFVDRYIYLRLIGREIEDMDDFLKDIKEMDIESKKESTDPNFIGVEYDDSEFYEEYENYAKKYLGIKIDPAYVRSVSILECRYLVKTHEVLGDEFFKNTLQYNDRTFNDAMKLAKRRAETKLSPLAESIA